LSIPSNILAARNCAALIIEPAHLEYRELTIINDVQMSISDILDIFVKVFIRARPRPGEAPRHDPAAADFIRAPTDFGNLARKLDWYGMGITPK
jgi:hypothetical protein